MPLPIIAAIGAGAMIAGAIGQAAQEQGYNTTAGVEYGREGFARDEYNRLDQRGQRKNVEMQELGRMDNSKFNQQYGAASGGYDKAQGFLDTTMKDRAMGNDLAANKVANMRSAAMGRNIASQAAGQRGPLANRAAGYNAQAQGDAQIAEMAAVEGSKEQMANQNAYLQGQMGVASGRQGLANSATANADATAGRAMQGLYQGSQVEQMFRAQGQHGMDETMKADMQQKEALDKESQYDSEKREKNGFWGRLGGLSSGLLGLSDERAKTDIEPQDSQYGTSKIKDRPDEEQGGGIMGMIGGLMGKGGGSAAGGAVGSMVTSSEETKTDIMGQSGGLDKLLAELQGTANDKATAGAAIGNYTGDQVRAMGAPQQNPQALAQLNANSAKGAAAVPGIVAQNNKEAAARAQQAQVQNQFYDNPQFAGTGVQPNSAPAPGQSMQAWAAGEHAANQARAAEQAQVQAAAQRKARMQGYGVEPSGDAAQDEAILRLMGERQSKLDAQETSQQLKTDSNAMKTANWEAMMAANNARTQPETGGGWGLPTGGDGIAGRQLPGGPGMPQPKGKTSTMDDLMMILQAIGAGAGGFARGGN